MVGSWYLTHVTKNVVWIFMPLLFVFILQTKRQGSCMSKHENKRYAVCRTKSMLNAYAWWCNDSCKMWDWNVITDKCRNDMFIMMLKRCLCSAWYECIYGHESPKNHLSLLHIWGCSAPCVQLRRRYGSFNFPRKRRDPHTMHVWWHDADAQKRNRGIYTAWQYPQIIIQQRRTWPLGYMHDDMM